MHEYMHFFTKYKIKCKKKSRDKFSICCIVMIEQATEVKHCSTRIHFNPYLSPLLRTAKVVIKKLHSVVELCFTSAICFSWYQKFLYFVAAIYFSWTKYIVDEDGGPARPELVLSNPLPTDITLLIRTNDITATGE